MKWTVNKMANLKMDTEAVVTAATKLKKSIIKYRMIFQIYKKKLHN